jgi:hypothetical protein
MALSLHKDDIGLLSGPRPVQPLPPPPPVSTPEGFAFVTAAIASAFDPDKPHPLTAERRARIVAALKNVSQDSWSALCSEQRERAYIRVARAETNVHRAAAQGFYGELANTARRAIFKDARAAGRARARLVADFQVALDE